MHTKFPPYPRRHHYHRHCHCTYNFHRHRKLNVAILPHASVFLFLFLFPFDCCTPHISPHYLHPAAAATSHVLIIHECICHLLMQSYPILFQPYKQFSECLSTSFSESACMILLIMGDIVSIDKYTQATHCLSLDPRGFCRQSGKNIRLVFFALVYLSACLSTYLCIRVCDHVCKPESEYKCIVCRCKCATQPSIPKHTQLVIKYD